MSWQTDLFCNITFFKSTYNTKSEVEYALSTVKKEIQACENSLRTLAFITEPNKFNNTDESNGYWVEHTLEEAIDDLKYAIIEEYKLELLLENWDKCHNEEGLAIPPPFDYESAFLDGDFIKTVENPDGH